jgi:hypothetical protein
MEWQIYSNGFPFSKSVPNQLFCRFASEKEKKKKSFSQRHISSFPFSVLLLLLWFSRRFLHPEFISSFFFFYCLRGALTIG